MNDTRIVITRDQLAAAILTTDHKVDHAVGRAADALAAWRAFPGFIRRGYALEARRLARRVAVAVLELVEAAAAADERHTHTPGTVPAEIEGNGGPTR